MGADVLEPTIPPGGFESTTPVVLSCPTQSRLRASANSPPPKKTSATRSGRVGLVILGDFTKIGVFGEFRFFAFLVPAESAAVPKIAYWTFDTWYTRTFSAIFTGQSRQSLVGMWSNGRCRPPEKVGLGL